MHFIVSALSPEALGELWGQIMIPVICFSVILTAKRKKSSGWNVAAMFAVLFLIGCLVSAKSHFFAFVISVIIIVIFWILSLMFKKSQGIILGILTGLSFIAMFLLAGFSSAMDRAAEIKGEQNPYQATGTKEKYTVTLPGDWKRTTSNPKFDLFASNASCAMGIIFEDTPFESNAAMGKAVRKLFEKGMEKSDFTEKRSVMIDNKEWEFFSFEGIHDGNAVSYLYYVHTDTGGSYQIMFITESMEMPSKKAYLTQIAQSFRFTQGNDSE